MKKTIGTIIGTMVVSAYGVAFMMTNHYDNKIAEIDAQYSILYDEKTYVEDRNVELQQHVFELSNNLEKQQAEIEALKERNEDLRDRVRELKEKKESKPVSVSRSGFPSSVLKTMTGFHVTYYNYNSGATSTGVPPKDGITAAVDPSVIPYGSKLKITLPSGKVLYRIAQDTGSAVKKKNNGKVIDIYSTQPTNVLLDWGRKRGVKVEILGSGA